MARFIVGDELGNLKTLRFALGQEGDAPQLKTIHQGSVEGSTRAVQVLAVNTADNETIVRSHPSVVSARSVLSCTANGALRRTRAAEGQVEADIAALPTRLCDWKLAPNGDAFAYGGDEVEVSVWDTEKAFTAPPVVVSKPAPPAGKKRKRNDVLLPGEIWRAKNVANDNLGLRQPVHNTSLTFISSTSTSAHDIVAGTQYGHVRRYDTRAARKPVADWDNVVKIGGVRAVQKGLNEHELFVSDAGCNLMSLDLRNGHVAYSYKGIAGAVVSMAPAPSLLVSAALDRLVRIHSTFSPQLGQQDRKGEVLQKVFSKSVPTVVAWDQRAVQPQTALKDAEEAEEKEETDRLWEEMEDADDETSARKKQRK
uniref:Ribosome biogenesis protein NSA1 n=1 Tax=Schizophyllum commune (strain H4-8 / FGSC 9210) TaxID=578458 RepID=D8PSH8_SCHCM